MASQGKAEKNWSLIVPGVLLIFFGALCAFYPGITLLSVTFVAGAGFVFAVSVSYSPFISNTCVNAKQQGFRAGM